MNYTVKLAYLHLSSYPQKLTISSNSKYQPTSNQDNLTTERDTNTESIPSSAQYVTLQKYFSHPSLVIYFSPTLPIKLKLRLRKQVGDY